MEEIHDHEKTFRGRDDSVTQRQDSDVWVKMPNDDTEIVQGQNFNNY